MRMLTTVTRRLVTNCLSSLYTSSYGVPARLCSRFCTLHHKHSHCPLSPLTTTRTSWRHSTLLFPHPPNFDSSFTHFPNALHHISSAWLPTFYLSTPLRLNSSTFDSRINLPNSSLNTTHSARNLSCFSFMNLFRPDLTSVLILLLSSNPLGPAFSRFVARLAAWYVWLPKVIIYGELSMMERVLAAVHDSATKRPAQGRRYEAVWRGIPNNLDALAMNQTARRSRCKSILFSSSRSILSRPLSPRALGSQEGGTHAADDVLGRPCASTDREIHRVDVDSLHNYAVSVLTSIPKQPPPLPPPSLTPHWLL